MDSYFTKTSTQLLTKWAIRILHHVLSFHDFLDGHRIHYHCDQTLHNIIILYNLSVWPPVGSNGEEGNTGLSVWCWWGHCGYQVQIQVQGLSCGWGRGPIPRWPVWQPLCWIQVLLWVWWLHQGQPLNMVQQITDAILLFQLSSCLGQVILPDDLK